MKRQRSRLPADPRLGSRSVAGLIATLALRSPQPAGTAWRSPRPNRLRRRRQRPRRASAAALSGQGQEHGRGQLRQQSVPRLGAAVEGCQRTAERIRDLVAGRQARPRLQGALQRTVGSASRATSGSATPPKPRCASIATRTTSPRRSAASASSSTTAFHARPATARPSAGCPSTSRTARNTRRTSRPGLFPTDDPAERARLCLSCHFGNADRFVTHRHDGRRASADVVRARDVHDGRAGALQDRFRIGRSASALWDGVQGVGDRAGACRVRDDGSC